MSSDDEDDDLRRRQRERRRRDDDDADNSSDDGGGGGGGAGRQKAPQRERVTVSRGGGRPPAESSKRSTRFEEDGEDRWGPRKTTAPLVVGGEQPKDSESPKDSDSDEDRGAPAPAPADDSDSDDAATNVKKPEVETTTKPAGNTTKLGQMLDAKIAEIGPMRALYRTKASAYSSNKDKTEASRVPEVHFIGEISEAGGTFAEERNGLVCSWHVQWEEPWMLLEGESRGQTQTATSTQGYPVPWNHPVDVHFAARSALGWPKIVVQVHSLDEHGRSNLAGYGFAHLPMTAGHSEIEVACWRPTGSMRDEVATFFLGNTPQLTNNDVICTKAAWTSRCRLVTTPAGTVKIQLAVILRHFAEQNVDGI